MKLTDAIFLVCKYHKDDTKLPYVLDVLMEVWEFPLPYKIVAVLHNILETKITIDKLAELGYDSDVIEAIDTLTQREGEITEDYTKRISENRIALIIKEKMNNV